MWWVGGRECAQPSCWHVPQQPQACRACSQPAPRPAHLLCGGTQVKAPQSGRCMQAAQQASKVAPSTPASGGRSPPPRSELFRITPQDVLVGAGSQGAAAGAGASGWACGTTGVGGGTTGGGTTGAGTTGGTTGACGVGTAGCGLMTGGCCGVVTGTGGALTPFLRHAGSPSGPLTRS